MENAPLYSLLLRFKSEILLREKSINKIKYYLKKGIKVIVITDISIYSAFSDCEDFINNYMLQLFVTDKITEQFKVCDGLTTDSQNQCLTVDSEVISAFNYKQYKVEHASPNEHLMVKAGAGTGKTTVMVQRVMYLIEKVNVKLEEIVMITFTREAAQEMFQRLKEELFSRYKLTKSPRYLNYIEGLKKMKISTIHSFAKILIQEIGSTLGYGANVEITSFKMERKRVIERFLNEHFKEDLTNGKLMNEIYPLRLYELIDIAVSFWERMENRGMTGEDINELEWGEADQYSTELNELFKVMFIKCEAEFQKLKENQNSVLLSDLTRQVDLASRDENAFQKLSKQIKYLIVDEFQDSDDVQIALFSRLQKSFNAKVFVVGDIKQSIYRFRGANDTAFASLKKELEATQSENVIVKEYPLTKNYRTSKQLLDKLDAHFQAWGKEDLLTYSVEDDKLIGIQSTEDEKNYKVENQFTFNDADLKMSTIKLIREAIGDIDQMKKDHPEIMRKKEEKGHLKLATLVRTRRQAKMIEKWCKEEGIPVELNIGGTFFISDAVKDFKSLVEALLFPDRIASLVEFINSPYIDIQIHWSEIALFEQNKIISALKEKIKDETTLDLQNNIDALKIKPVFSVLRDVIKESNVINNYYNVVLKQYPEMDKEKRIEQAKRKTLQYKKNLNHLIELCHQSFNEDFATLYRIHQWIELNMATNRDENEPSIKDEKIKETFLQIVTVHSSKGLEYHTVLIPFTGRKYRFDRTEMILNDNKTKAGWYIKNKALCLASDNFNDLNLLEDKQVEKEEARLFYVAMTRARERLWIIKNTKEKQFNWTELVNMKSGE